MKIYSVLLLLLISGIMGCSILNKADQYTYWVNSLKSECVGVAPMQCMQIQKGKEYNPESWQHFYYSIEGFEYEEGFIYKIVVQEEQLPADLAPADGSSIKYTLVKVLEKKRDDKLRLHDIWVLETILGQELELKDDQKHPRIEINLKDMRVMGNDGCNNLFGDIKKIDAKNLVFGVLAGTRMACINMEIPDKFNPQMSHVKSYKIENLKLYLYDQDGDELLRFQKTD